VKGKEITFMTSDCIAKNEKENSIAITVLEKITKLSSKITILKELSLLNKNCAVIVLLKICFPYI